MDAVIFDLWETLVPLPSSIRRDALDATARALGADNQEFRIRWAAGRSARETRGLKEFFHGFRTDHGYGWTEAQMQGAADARATHFRLAFREIADEAIGALKELGRRGHPLGLVSNCSSDVRALLDEANLTPYFDSIALSCEVGVMKPDPRLFEKVLDELGARKGWYVGDGNDEELAGARRVGLQDVLLDTGAGRRGTHKIDQLSQLLDLVKE